MPHRSPYSGISLLVVDDDRNIRSLIARIAGAWEYETEESPNAEEAITRLQQRKFNVVLTDIRMGKMDGIAFAELVREKMPSTAVVIMTGNPSPKTARQSQEMGVVYYLQKPIQPDVLGETLRIAATWNIGMLVDRAARRILALRKGHERDQENQLKAIKDTIRIAVTRAGGAGVLRDFVYSAKVDGNQIFIDLNQKFSLNSVKHF